MSKTEKGVIEVLDISAWVARAPADKRHFREAVHIILSAIGTSTALHTRMIMKGGLLMALRYDSTRFTKDADFSTAERYVSGAERDLLEKLDAQLALSNEHLTYDVMCRRQTAQMRPARGDASFPTLCLSIGYAPRSKPRERQRLLAGQAPNVVEIDYSYNEAVLDVEVLRLTDGNLLQVYSLLQQPTRNRNRRQDVYDLALLLQSASPLDALEQARLLECLVTSASARAIGADCLSMRDPAVKTMAAQGYNSLQPEIEGPLPPFESIYSLVKDFYEHLPWSQK